MDTHKLLNVLEIDSPLGTIIALSDAHAIHMIAFGEVSIADQSSPLLCQGFVGLRQPFPPTPRLRRAGSSSITLRRYSRERSMGPLDLLKDELARYFAGELTEFTVPLHKAGTPFQQKTWNALEKIPYGTLCCYEEIACAIDQPTACRAVANANAENQFVIVVPCHRVVRKGGKLGGYAGGVERKEWLVRHEARNLLDSNCPIDLSTI